VFKLLETPVKGMLKVFMSYSNSDSALREELEKHLAPLKRLGKISS